MTESCKRLIVVPVFALVLLHVGLLADLLLAIFVPETRKTDVEVAIALNEGCKLEGRKGYYGDD